MMFVNIGKGLFNYIIDSIIITIYYFKIKYLLYYSNTKQLFKIYEIINVDINRC